MKNYKKTLENKDYKVINYDFKYTDNRKSILFLPLTSSFAHIVRIFVLIDLINFVFRNEHFKFIILLPRNISQSQYEYIHKNASSIKNILIIYSKEDQENLNKSSNVSKGAEKDSGLGFSRWIKDCNRVAKIIMPSCIVYSPGFLGKYVRIKKVHSIGIVDPSYMGIGYQLALKPELQDNFITKAFSSTFADLIIRKIFFKNLMKDWVNSNIRDIPPDINSVFGEFSNIVCPSVLYLDYTKDSKFGDNVINIGPLLETSRTKIGISLNDRASREDTIYYNKILQLIKERSLNRKNYLIFLGGSAFDSKLFNRFVAKLIESIKQRRKEFNVIVIGGQLEIRSFQKEDKENLILIDKYFPISEILKFIDYAITTPGQGAIIEMVYNAVPTVCIPLNIDQLLHGDIISYLGLGILPQRPSILNVNKRDAYVGHLLDDDFIGKVIKSLEKIEKINKSSFKKYIKEIELAFTRQPEQIHIVFEKVLHD